MSYSTKSYETNIPVSIGSFEQLTQVIEYNQ